MTLQDAARAALTDEVLDRLKWVLGSTERLGHEQAQRIILAALASVHEEAQREQERLSANWVDAVYETEKQAEQLRAELAAIKAAERSAIDGGAARARDAGGAGARRLRAAMIPFTPAYSGLDFLWLLGLLFVVITLNLLWDRRIRNKRAREDMARRMRRRAGDD